MTGVAVPRDSVRTVTRDLVALTKPRIISLLLVTTVAPMFVAGRPGWLLLLWVTVGGYLMAGGANAKAKASLMPARNTVSVVFML